MLQKSCEQRHRLLTSASTNVGTWWIKVRKVKAIYHTLDMFNTDQQNYVAEGWLPLDQLETVQGILVKASVSTYVSVPPKDYF